METEVPEILRRVSAVTGETFSFHSSRVPMRHVEPSQLSAMNLVAPQAVEALVDADVSVVAYACLVAVMAEGPGKHRDLERQLSRAGDRPAPPFLSSAGALVDAVHHLGAKRVSIITPYMKPLTEMVVAYLEAEGVQVQDAISLEVDDNLAVGRLDPSQLPELARRLDTSDADAVVLSACVQMPSLSAVPEAEEVTGLPVITASIATSWRILRSLNLAAVAPNTGALFATG